MATEAWIQTYTGKCFDLNDIRPEMIDPLDIAHALSMQCRYNGHVRRFYSVAEHCVCMHDYFEENRGEFGFLPLYALLHDAAEAYIGDMLQPLKRAGCATKRWKELEAKIDDAIFEFFELDAPSEKQKAAVKEIDLRILIDEARVLMCAPPRPWSEAKAGLQPIGAHIHGLYPSEARDAYLARMQQHKLRAVPEFET